MPVEIVISVSGGIVDTVHCSQPAIVTVVDCDADPDDFDVPGFVEFEVDYCPIRALVSRSGASTAADLHPQDAHTINMAEERGIIPRVEDTPTCSIPYTKDLATVLAALRHWQVSLEKSEGAITMHFPHFERVSPLTSVEIDLLCERLNFGEPDIQPEELRAWRTTLQQQFGSEEK